MTVADRDTPVLPSVMRDCVLAVWLLARAAGSPVPDAPEISASEAYRKVISVVTWPRRAISACSDMPAFTRLVAYVWRS